MKKSTKLVLTGGIVLMSAFIASSCTSNFCMSSEKSRILFAIEPGVTEYFSSKAEAEEQKNEEYSYVIEQVFSENENLWRKVTFDSKNNYYKWNSESSSIVKFKQISSINETATNKKYAVPGSDYFKEFDYKVLKLALSHTAYSPAILTKEEAESALTDFGYYKFYGDEDNVWGNYQAINSQLSFELGVEACPTRDYVSLYQTTMNTGISGTKSCIAIEDYKYGMYGQDEIQVQINKKDWGYAWSKGPISGLIVYPVAWLTDILATSFAGGLDSGAMLQGWPQLLALLVVTVIVRLIIFAITFKATYGQQKIQALQPELAKIQAKYPNANTNQSEKQRLAEEQMKLYKKNKVNPLSQLLIMVVQFPIFIGVWGAMTGSAVLSTGTFLNLNLSTSIWTALSNFDGMPSNMYGWWTALVLFIVMAVAQFLSMKVPQWIAKAKTKKVARLGVNPAQKQQNKTMTIVSYGMMIMIIVMGFTLPAAMGVYWLISAFISLGLSLLTQAIVNKKKHK